MLMGAGFVCHVDNCDRSDAVDDSFTIPIAYAF